MPIPDPQTPFRGTLARLFGLLVAALIGATIATLGLEWSWWSWTKAPQGQLQQAEQALQKGDDKEAAALFTRLADQNNGNAQYWLGHMTEHGLGVARDPTKAIELYKQAAAHGVVTAEFQLGRIYLEGNIVLPDFAQAKSYLESAAYRGDDRAAMLLGRIYRDGTGMAPDLVQGYAWLEVATLKGNLAAKAERDALLARMSPADQRAGIIRAGDIYNQVKPETAPRPQGAT
jgi:TPR repeat protein